MKLKPVLKNVAAKVEGSTVRCDGSLKVINKSVLAGCLTLLCRALFWALCVCGSVVLTVIPGV